MSITLRKPILTKKISQYKRSEYRGVWYWLHKVCIILEIYFFTQNNKNQHNNENQTVYLEKCADTSKNSIARKSIWKIAYLARV